MLEFMFTPGSPVAFRYTGYCPQLKYHAEKSYSKLTAELLTSPEVNHSSRLVLHTGHADSAQTLTNIPDSNLKKVIPGYTGRYHALNTGGVTEHGMENYFILGTNTELRQWQSAAHVS